VAAVAGTLAQAGRLPVGLQGTVTYADSLGNGDERSFVRSVTDRFAFRNEVVEDDWPWRRDGEPPPVTDAPFRDYPFFARDRRVSRMLHKQGASALLTGLGPDNYLPLTAAHVLDLTRRGQVKAAAQELFRWSVYTNETIFRAAFQHVLAPAISPVQRWHLYRTTTIPSWFTERFNRRFDIEQRLALSDHSPPVPSHYDARVARSLARLSGWVPLRYSTYGVEVKHPLLFLPLVEFALSLPHHLRTDLGWSKPLLRNAVTDALPVAVRSRVSKGLLAPRLCWALMREREQIAALMRRSILADLGCIEPKRLMSALETVRAPPIAVVSALNQTCSLETWLAVRSGRYECTETSTTLLPNERVHHARLERQTV
jgi:hypothetical protein